MKNIFFAASAALLFAGHVATAEVSADICADEAPAIAVTMELTVGQSDSVVLDGNPTTGFTWNIAEQKGDAAEVSLELRHAEPADDEPPLCGAPTPTVVTVTGVKPGSSTITLEYKRAWEKETPALRRVTFEVTVK